MNRNRRKIHRGKRKSKKVIIITSIVLLLTLSIGYSAFQTNIQINTKGKIVIPEGCTEGNTWEFTQKNESQEFKAPCTGTYKLETWGAQGGQNNLLICEGIDKCSIGGFGGYSSGHINLEKNQKIYLQVC